MFDALEFDEALASIDVLYDLAFLLMDLGYRRLDALAAVTFNRYLEATEDHGGLAALPLFLSSRAAIRAHVTASTIETAKPEKRDALVEAARRYLDLALRFLDPPAPRLVAVGGLSGTGKSTLARGLAPAVGRFPGAVVLRSDVTRKELAGVDRLTRLGPEGYGPAMTRRVYDTLRERARTILAAGHAVIADAVYARPEERAALEAGGAGGRRALHRALARGAGPSARDAHRRARERRFGRHRRRAAPPTRYDGNHGLAPHRRRRPARGDRGQGARSLAATPTKN